MDNRLTHRLEDRQRSFQIRLIAADHDAERAGDGAFIAAADRGIEGAIRLAVAASC